MIKFANPSMGTEEEAAAIRVIRSGYLTSGPEVMAFEKEFAEYIGAPYVVAVNSCTNALRLSFYYESWIKELRNKVVECPAMTFASVAHTIVQAGGLQLKFTDEYHAGNYYQLKGTNIWDCAHRIERGMYKQGQVMCFSFYPNKVLSSCEGGAIATDNKEFVDWLKGARWNGRYARTSYDYDIKFAGWKMNMTDMQAAIAREQLKKLDGFNERRAEIRVEYDKHFGQLNEWHYLYVIEVENRPKFMKLMAEEEIETSYHYKPLYEQGAYKQDGAKFPYLESIKNKIVSLPIYPSLTDQEVQKIIQLTKWYINEK